MFSHTIIVTGKHQDLDEISRRLAFRPEQGEIKKFADPGDARLTDTTMQRFSDAQGTEVKVGTTRLEIGFNGDHEKLKQDILARFSNVTVTFR